MERKRLVINTNLRPEPTIQCTPYTILKSGTVLNTDGMVGDFYKVVAYVHKSCVADNNVTFRTGVNMDLHNPWGHARPTALPYGSVVRIVYNVSMGVGSTDLDAAASFYAYFMNDCFANNVRPVLVLNQSTGLEGRSWYHGAHMSIEEWKQTVNYFAPFVASIAQRYGKWPIYQIWNEQDQTSHAAAGMPAEAYGYMLSKVAPALLDAGATEIITGGHAAGDPGYFSAALRAAGGSVRGLTGIGLHPYGVYGSKSFSWAKRDSLANVASKWGKFGLPIYVTEVGICGGTVSQTALRDYWNDLKATARKNPISRTFIWYAWAQGQDGCNAYPERV